MGAFLLEGSLQVSRVTRTFHRARLCSTCFESPPSKKPTCLGVQVEILEGQVQEQAAPGQVMAPHGEQEVLDASSLWHLQHSKGSSFRGRDKQAKGTRVLPHDHDGVCKTWWQLTDRAMHGQGCSLWIGPFFALKKSYIFDTDGDTIIGYSTPSLSSVNHAFYCLCDSLAADLGAVGIGGGRSETLLIESLTTLNAGSVTKRSSRGLLAKVKACPPSLGATTTKKV